MLAHRYFGYSMFWLGLEGFGLPFDGQRFLDVGLLAVPLTAPFVWSYLPWFCVQNRGFFYFRELGRSYVILAPSILGRTGQD